MTNLNTNKDQITRAKDDILRAQRRARIAHDLRLANPRKEAKAIREGAAADRRLAKLEA